MLAAPSSSARLSPPRPHIFSRLLLRESRRNVLSSIFLTAQLFIFPTLSSSDLVSQTSLLEPLSLRALISKISRSEPRFLELSRSYHFTFCSFVLLASPYSTGISIFFHFSFSHLLSFPGLSFFSLSSFSLSLTPPRPLSLNFPSPNFRQ